MARFAHHSAASTELYGLNRLWKTTHPSEDSEALRKMGHILLREGSLPPAVLLPQALKWFALHTSSRHEKSVARHLTQREIDFYLPLSRSERKWRDGSRVTVRWSRLFRQFFGVLKWKNYSRNRRGGGNVEIVL